MADVSHELGSLRFVVDSPLSSKVAMFNNQAQQRQQSQLLNPFSSANDGRSSPKPTFSKDEYGKPLAGSLTEMRGQKANMHVLREMLELCQIIDSEGYKVNDEPDMRVIPFGELFNIYNYISDKVVGILLRARKYKYVQFEGEMLFQRRDDNVPVFLLRPIQSIRHEIDFKIDSIKRSTSPAPMATKLMLDKGAHQQKLQENALRTPSRSGTPAKLKSATPSPASSKPGSKAATPVREINNAESAKPPIAAKATESTEVKAEPSTVPSVVENETPVSEVTVPEASTESVKSSVAIDVTPASEEVNAENLQNTTQTTDLSTSASDGSITINDLPTIVIEATAVYVGNGEALAEEQSTPSPAEEVAPTPADSSTAAV